MNRKELAIANHDKNYNCAQSVACTFYKEIGVDETTLFKACEGLGLGMGCMECTCGALSGAVLLAGFKNSDGNLSDPHTKVGTYEISKQIVTGFQEKCGSTVCKDLKGAETGTPLCSCADCIKNAVEIAEEILGL